MINNLDSIILGIKDGEKAIEDLRVVLKKKRKEEVITTQTFNYALQCPQTTKEAIVHEILLHFIQNPGEQSLEQVIQYSDGAIQSRIYAKTTQ
ncbi:MAG: hypothetical protein WBIAU1_03990 [Wolbachia endosymbiont of Drosophila biauraria]|nr:MAG: hypothetical protein WBIAU1_03990 [Wolbachia endosymbiont of Drosophila biauraria]